MKILSNFDTHLGKKLLKEHEESFGEGNVLLVHRSKLYFYKHIGLPLILYAILLMIGAYFVYSLEGIGFAVEIGFWVVFGLYFLVLIAKTSSKWVDYRMDFLVVTPREVMKYDQEGVFSKHVEKIQTDKIKSTLIKKKGFLKSFLNIGEIKFLAEGDRDEGDIVMRYVDALEDTERKIRVILGLDNVQ